MNTIQRVSWGIVALLAVGIAGWAVQAKVPEASSAGDLSMQRQNRPLTQGQEQNDLIGMLASLAESRQEISAIRLEIKAKLSKTGKQGAEKEGEETGAKLALNAPYVKVQNSARFLLNYDPQTTSFAGTVTNATANKKLTRVSVSIRLSNGSVLGPTVPLDLAPGQVLPVRLAAVGESAFTEYSVYPAVGAAEDAEAVGEQGGQRAERVELVDQRNRISLEESARRREERRLNMVRDDDEERLGARNVARLRGRQVRDRGDEEVGLVPEDELSTLISETDLLKLELKALHEELASAGLNR
jgi:hypothetical protein